ncbi:hypothetical protein ACTA71_010248 [Dictyostelium dimigraforme]
MSQDLVWSIIKKNNAFLKSSHGVTLSAEPGNLRNKNSLKYSGLARRTTIDVAAKNGKVVVSSKIVKKAAFPAQSQKSTTFSTVNTRKTARFVKTLATQYAPELRAAALGRLHRIQSSLRSAKKAAARKAKKN